MNANIPDALWPSRRSIAFTVYLIACVVLIALNLRTVFSSFAAVLTEWTALTGMGPGAVALISALPVTVVGLAAPLVPLLARRWGTWSALAVGLVLIAAGLGIRSLPAGDALWPLWVGTLAAALGISVGNVVLPVIVKMDFPSSIGLMSGIYTMTICASAALGAAFTQPLLGALGDVRLALGAWAGFALLVLIAIAPALWSMRGLVGRVHRPAPASSRRRPRTSAGPRTVSSAGSMGAGGARPADHDGQASGQAEDGAVVVPHPEREASPFRSRTAWWLTLMMAAQAMSSFAVFAWMAPILRHRGMEAGAAGTVVAASIMLQVAGSLVAPILAARMRRQSWLAVAAAVLTGAGFVLVIIGPMGAMGVWAAMLGVGQGALTAVALTMIGLRTATASMASRLSGMMQGVGYTLGSSGTFLVGQLFAVTGSYVPAAVLFACTGTLAAVFGYLAGRDRTVHVRE
ncbi:MFS transporter [Micrococcus lylae]|uniref:MFS transporter n=1 Tax=Micrococcus lylae TaxID=1273 RepID=UPI003EBBBC76